MSRKEMVEFHNSWLIWYFDKLISINDCQPRKSHIARARILSQPFIGSYEINESYGNI